MTRARYACATCNTALDSKTGYVIIEGKTYCRACAPGRQTKDR